MLGGGGGGRGGARGGGGGGGRGGVGGKCNIHSGLHMVAALNTCSQAGSWPDGFRV